MSYSSQFSSFSPEDNFGPFYWWMGQVVDESTWVDNTSHVLHDRDEIPGWGYRYKVRIFGRDTQAKDVPDEELEMAEVLYPVTAGSGHGNSGQTANIRQGSYVIGFYKDGVDGMEPIIMGTLGNNSQTRTEGQDPSEGYIPRTGGNGLNGPKKIPTNDIWNNISSSSHPIIDSVHEVHHADVRQYDQYYDGSPADFYPKTYACDGSSGDMKGVQIALNSMIGIVNRIKSNARSFSSAVSDLQGNIDSLINRFSILISDLIKSMYNRIRGFVVNKVNVGLSALESATIPPFLRPGFNKVSEKTTSVVQCLFNKIISGLLSLVKKLLQRVVKKYVSTPICATESFLGSVISNTLGGISGGLSSILKGISSALGGLTKIVNAGLGILDIISGALKFLSCEENNACNMSTEWSFWYGAKDTAQSLSSSFNKSIDSTLKNIFTPGSNISYGSGNSISSNSCSTGPVLCGPPTILITGGGGSGAKANAIISKSGSIIGVDIVSYGSGYTSTPTIQVIDNCGNGNGAVIAPLMGFPLDGVSTRTPLIGTTPTLGGIPKNQYTNLGGNTNGNGTNAEFNIELTDDGNYITKPSQITSPTEGVITFSGNGNISSSDGSNGNATFTGTGTFSPNASGNGGEFTGTGSLVGTFTNNQTVSATGNYTGTGTLGDNGSLTGSASFVGTSSNGTVIQGEVIINGSTTAKPSIPIPTGSGYSPGDFITISGSSLGGGSENDLTLRVDNVDSNGGVLSVISQGNPRTTYSNLNASTSGTGSGSSFEVKKSSGGYEVFINNPGNGYHKNDIMTISGTYIGGSTENDLKFVITEISEENGGILNVSTSSDDIQITSDVDSGLSVIGTVVLDGGVGYLPAPDGSTGSGGGIFSKPGDTIVYNEDTGYLPYPSGITLPLSKGDDVYLPPGSLVELYDNDGNVVQVLKGQGPTTPIPIEDYGTITSPTYLPDPSLDINKESPTGPNGIYPVVLSISDVVVTNSGVNYSEEDVIKIIPDYGAVLKPTYGSFGKLEKVDIINPGMGFNEIPRIYIESKTGINATLIPVFAVNRIGDILEENEIIPSSEKIINIVDCVGRF